MKRNSLRRSIERMAEAPLGRHPFDLLQVLVVLMVFFGVWQAFFAASDLEQELARAKASTVVETGDVATAEPGTDAVLGGRLGAVDTGYVVTDPDAAAYRLVIYERQRWKCEENKDGGHEGVWRWSADVAPDAITLNGREIAISLDRPAHMSGEQFSSPTVMWGDGRWCDGRWQDSVRFAGYREGDRVCVFGRKGTGASLVVERLHGGDCGSFLTFLARLARGARTVGWVFLGIGLGVEVIWLVTRVPAHLARRRR
jgi:hypothetical protein